jgi:putative peptidoglycan lipid II flippase
MNLKSPGVKEMIKLIPPRTLTISINQLEYFATGFFATAMTAGSLTLFEIAQRLMSAPIRIFAVPIGQASLPFLAKESGAEKMDEFKVMIVKSLHKILYLTLPASVLLLILRVPLVRILYGAKTFPWEATLLTGKAVAVLSLSIFAQSAHHIISRSFYALEDTKTPFRLATVSMAVNITIAYIATFMLKLDIVGIAWALTISSIFHFVTLLYALSKKVGGFETKSFIVPIIKMGIASLVTGLFLWGPMQLLDQFVLDTTRVIPLLILTGIVIIIGFTVYIVLSKVFQIEELQEFKKLAQKIGNWRKVLDSSDEVIETASSSGEVNPS